MLSRDLLSTILERLLSPLVRFCIRHSIKVQHVDEFVRKVFVRESSIELQRLGQKITASNISAISGLQRRDISHYINEEVEIDEESDLIRRVIGLWQGGESFRTSNGAPRTLSFGTEASEFSILVSQVSTDKNPASILRELERLELVEKTKFGVRLIKSTFSPREDPERGFAIVSGDVSDLIETAEKNLFSLEFAPSLHVRTEYDKVRADDVEQIKSWIMTQGHQFHKKVRTFLSKFDQDINPKKNFSGPTTRVVVGAFSFVEEKGRNRK